MVTQQEFIQGLIEPLMTGMRPLALADIPGAMVRGVASGQPFSEAFSSVMSDPLSMEGRVYGEDVTGDPYSGLVFELLTDPAALAGLGAAGLGGVGMALGRRYARGAGSEAAEGVLERLMREGRSVDEALDLLWQGTNAEQALAQELEMGLARESAEGTAGRRFAPTTDPYSEEKNRIMAEAVEAGPGEDLPTTSYRLVDELMRLVEEDPARFLTREDIYSPEDLSGVMSEKQINRLRSKPSAQIEQGLFLPPGGAEEGQFIRSNLIKELLGGRGQAGIDDPLGPATAEVRELLMPHLKQLYESGAIPQEGIPISRLSRGYSDPLPEHAYQYYRNPSDVPFPTLMEGSLGEAKYGYYPYKEPETFPFGAREVLTHRKLRPDEPGLNVNQLHPMWPSPTKEEGMSFVSHWRGGELPVSHEGTTKNTLHFTETQSGETIKGLEQDLTNLPGAEGVVQRYAGRIAPLGGGQDTGDVLRRKIASGAVELGRGRGLDPAWLGPVRLPPEAGHHEQSTFYYSMMGAARELHEEVLGSPVPRVSTGFGQFGEAEDLFIHLKNTASELSDIPKGSFVNQAGKVVTPQLKSTAPENQRNILTSLFQVAQDPSLSGLSHSGAREVKLSVGLGSEKGRQLYGEVSPSGEVGGKVGNTIDDLQNIVDVYEGNISDREIMARQASGEVPESYSVFTERVAEEHNIDLRAMRSPEEAVVVPIGDDYDLTLDEVLEGVDPEQIEGLQEEIRRLTAGAETESHRGMIEKYIKRVTGVEPVEVYPRGAVQQQGYGDPVKYYPLRTESGEWVSPTVAALMEKLLKGGVPIVPGIIPLMMLQEREGSRYGS